MSDIALIVFIVLLVINAALLTFHPAWGIRRRPGGSRVRAVGPAEGRIRIPISLQIEHSVDGPARERLLAEAAWRVFSLLPEVEQVDIYDQHATLLGNRLRESADAIASAAIPMGNFLTFPAPAHAFRPDILTGIVSRARAPRDSGERHPHSALVDHFQLSAATLAAVENPNDPVDLVRAILRSGGLECTVEDDVILSGDDAVVVIRAPFEAHITPTQLSTAYLRFLSSGAARGVVVTPGLIYQRDIHTRELLAPNLLHAGPEGIQRMADAASSGGNPMLFAAGPAFQIESRRSRLGRAPAGSRSGRHPTAA